jgi:hypothetical protein
LKNDDCGNRRRSDVRSSTTASGGDRRKASQKRARPAAPKPVFAGPSWGIGDRVRWQHHTGTYLRDAVDEDLAEILIGQRTYRVKKVDLRSA